ncbi:MAG: hypothetical protein JXA72_05840 [Bacteroidales bacterium]|nr:hypothetical protein [Bacteroidales bacterium]
MHRICDEIEDQIMKKIDHIEVNIHVEPGEFKKKDRGELLI